MGDDLHSRFLQRHLAHQGTLFSYLLAAVHDFSRAEDLLQEVTLALWEGYGEYRESEPYLPWALGVARRKLARHFRDSGKREVLLSEQILEAAAETLEKDQKPLASEQRALLDCVKKLPDRQRELVRLRYAEGFSLHEVAARLHQTAASVNMALVRVRRTLLHCTGRALAEES